MCSNENFIIIIFTIAIIIILHSFSAYAFKVMSWVYGKTNVREGVWEIEEAGEVVVEANAHREDHHAEEDEALQQGHKHEDEVAGLPELLLDVAKIPDQSCRGKGE